MINQNSLCLHELMGSQAIQLTVVDILGSKWLDRWYSTRSRPSEIKVAVNYPIVHGEALRRLMSFKFSLLYRIISFTNQCKLFVYPCKTIHSIILMWRLVAEAHFNVCIILTKRETDFDRIERRYKIAALNHRNQTSLQSARFNGQAGLRAL